MFILTLENKIHVSLLQNEALRTDHKSSSCKRSQKCYTIESDTIIRDLPTSSLGCLDSDVLLSDERIVAARGDRVW